MKRILKRTKTENSVRNVYLVAFILLLLSYLFTLYANYQLKKQSARVDHTNAVIRTLDNILSKVTDGETGVRGYLLTKNIQFLFPYYGADQKADSLFRILTKMVEDNVQQEERLPELKARIDQRFELLRFHIKTFEANNRQITDTMMSLQYVGKKSMDDIREQIGVMQRYENRLLIERGEKAKKTTQAINTITIVSLTIAIALITFGLITYMHVSKERTKSLAAIEEYQSRLNVRINELDEANAELIRMRSLEKFAATGRIARTIAHEIRNPLTNINLASEQIKEGVETGSQDLSFLFDMIARNSSRINQLISDLLNSTKFSELNYEKVSVNEFVQETLQEAADRIALNHILLVKKFTASACDISIDKNKMKIALLNIIINAIEAMEGRKDSQLTIETVSENNKCRIVIDDNGSGMDKDALSRIFEPYFTSKPKGNGLGLTNTQNIILNHSGEITVESSRGKGTRFTIILDVLS